jgi:pseudouridine synthase
MSSNPKPPRRPKKPGSSRPARARRATPPKEPKEPEPQGQRLQKVLAAAGVASRRAAEALIEQGRVSVDGEVVRVQGRRVDPDQVRIEVDGERVNVNPRHEYIMLNKPAGVVSTASDPQGRRTVVDVARARGRVYPVGRLDVDTLGLILLTNHGELAHRLAHPRYGIERVYLAEVDGTPPDAAIRRLTEGVPLAEGTARAARARIARRASKRSHVEIVMTEGRKHEVRRMLDAVGLPLRTLVRVGFGPLRLGQLPAGEQRALTPEEVGALLKAVAL